MPRYDYTCPICHWAGERVATLATRDVLTCDNVIGNRDTGEQTDVKPLLCSAALVRDDGVALTAKMGHQWQP